MRGRYDWREVGWAGEEAGEHIWAEVSGKVPGGTCQLAKVTPRVQSSSQQGLDKGILGSRGLEKGKEQRSELSSEIWEAAVVSLCLNDEPCPSSPSLF